MSEAEMTTIQFVRGQDNGGTRMALTPAQRAGLACLVCQGTEDLHMEVGWVDDHPVRVHNGHLQLYRLGHTIAPGWPHTER